MRQLETGLAVGMEQVVTLFFKEQSRDMFPMQSPFSHNLQVRFFLLPVCLGPIIRFVDTKMTNTKSTEPHCFPPPHTHT
jgi:hypothetical protein